jgi:ATP-dependent protease Clp ATPase subunit
MSAIGEDAPTLDKSNVLLVGPTGSGMEELRGDWMV